jgi:hypothetical protein
MEVGASSNSPRWELIYDQKLDPQFNRFDVQEKTNNKD